MTSHRRRIESLDAERDHCEIMRILAGQEFAWDYQRSMIDMVFLRSLAAPRISGLISAQGYIVAVPQKRYDDTSIFMIEFVKNGYDSERGRALIARMNHIHARFVIRQDDYLYILTALMLEPIRWNARFGWRRMTEKEKDANYFFWREVGKRMGITIIPDSRAGCERFNEEYEREQFKRTASSVELSTELFKLLESWVPSLVRPLVKPGMSTLLDEKLLDHFAIARPPRWLKVIVELALKARARAMRWLPARRRAKFFVDGRIRSYPNGYAPEQLGPPDDWKPPRTAASRQPRDLPN
jgi:hypothetical protein